MSFKPTLPKELSVIVASQNSGATIERCLASLEGQNQAGAAEIIVVENSGDGVADFLEKRFPSVRVIKVGEPRLIPQLWAIGAKGACGSVIAFTTGQFVPAPEWLAENLRHHRSDYAAVGGTIENAEPASPTQWAVYFCRYSKFMLPFSPHVVRQVPGDNASYKRWVLEEYADLIKAGFWETVVNDQLSKEGHSLLMTPTIRVDHVSSFGMWAFCRQRLVHGHKFGSERRASASSTRRLLFVASSPLVPFIFLGKIVKEVFQKKRHRREFFVSLPVLSLFVLCWSLGESWGYLLGGPLPRSDGVND